MAQAGQNFNIRVIAYPLALRDDYADTEPEYIQGRFHFSPSPTQMGRLAVPLSDIQNRLLKKTVHKGKALGLRLDRGGMPVHPFDNLPPDAAPDDFYW